MGLTTRLKHAWNAFKDRDAPYQYKDLGLSSSRRPDRYRLNIFNERTIITSIYNRISIDVSSMSIEHCKKNQNGSYEDTINDSLNRCLTLSANIDQTHVDFIRDVVISMFDEGVVAIVPTRTDIDPRVSTGFKIFSLRTAKIIEWYPENVKVRMYDELTGDKIDRVLPKNIVAIIENPFYPVMNEPNSTLKRLNRKLNLLDSIDEQSASGKLDLIIQLPYTVRKQLKKDEADARIKDIEMQLSGNKYGVAYIDGTEKITQLNRPVENNLQSQIEYLTRTLYSQLGLTEEVFNGTADEVAMLNYYNRTIEPILTAITTEMTRKFLSKTAITQGQAIMFFRNPFKLVPVEKLAEIADKMTRNEIMSSNEFRSIIGYKPDKDPRADELRNKNLNASNDQLPKKVTSNSEEVMNNQNSKGVNQNGI